MQLCILDSAIQLLKIVSTLVGDRQNTDKMLLYAENHNQSISGGRSFAEILIGNSLGKSSISQESLLRGCSLHKMIRLITSTIGGHAYLNFMGNEFGHPKRVEFPMSSNNFSFSLANRHWDLLEDDVHYQLFSFDKDMMDLDKNGRILSRGLANIHHVNDTTMVTLNTDENKYGGRGLLGHDQNIQRTISRRADGMRFCLEVPLPSRSAQVYKLTRIRRA